MDLLVPLGVLPKAISLTFCCRSALFWRLCPFEDEVDASLEWGPLEAESGDSMVEGVEDERGVWCLLAVELASVESAANGAALRCRISLSMDGVLS